MAIFNLEKRISLWLAETKFALNCHKRLKALENRLWQARIKEGEHGSPLSQSVYLERLALESERSTTSIMEQELSHLRSELDKTLRVNRAATQVAPRTTGYSTTPSFYGYTTSAYPSPTTFAQYYNQYTYPYGQQATFVNSPSVNANSNSSSYLTPAQPSITSIDPAVLQSDVQSRTAQANVPTAPSVRTQASGNDGSTTSASPLLLAPTSTAPPPVSIPFQIPVASLPALKALGIMPVPKKGLPSSSEPPPAAVLVGVTENGNMLSLEINPQLLQQPQLSGLAILLSGLVKLTGGSSAAFGQSQNGGSFNTSNSAASDKSAVDGNEKVGK